jgi:coniferyl-aldehyde dehydrogenase
MPTSSTPDVRAILARMKEAQSKHGPPDFEERLRRLERLERAVIERKDALAAAVSKDFGTRSPHETLAAEVFTLVDAVRHARDHLRDWMEAQDREVPWALLPSRAQVISQPLGVVGIISPSSCPVLLTLSPLVGALAAGNRAMLKPSELVPETASLLRDVVAHAFSEDEVTLVAGGAEMGELFSRLPFDHLVFTGSSQVGKLVMRAASENLTPVTLELGGKSPAIVGQDYPAPAAAARIMAGKLFSAGQTCIAPDYALVPAGAREAFVTGCKAAVAKMYPTIERNPDYATIVSEQRLQRLHAMVADAVALGATVIELKPPAERLEGSRKLAPTLVLDASNEMLALREEIFGPILPIVTYGSLDEAIAYVAQRPRPLALYYFGHKRTAIDRVLAATTSGGVAVNETLLHAFSDDLPFGGVGPSGMGHYHGREGFLTFSKMKPVYWHARFGGRRLLLPPFGKTADRVLRFLVGK